MKNCILVSIYLLMSSCLFAQNIELDSLENALKKANDARQKVDILNELSIMLCDPIVWTPINDSLHFVKQKGYIEQALQLAKKLGYTAGEQRAHINLALHQADTMPITRMYTLGNELLQRSHALKYPQGVAMATLFIADYYRFQSEFSKSKDHFEDALMMTKRLGWRALTGWTYLILYQVTQRTELKYITNAFKISREIRDRPMEMFAYKQESTFYSWKGDFVNALKSALAVQKSAVELSSPLDLAWVYLNLCELNLKLDNPQKALENILKALEIARAKKLNKPNTAWIRYNVGRSYTATMHYTKALTNLQQALKVFHAMNPENPGVFHCKAALALVYARQNPPKKAIKVLKEAIPKLVTAFDKQDHSLKLAKLYIQNGDYAQAEEILQQSLESIDSFPSERLRIDIYEGFYALYQAQENFQQALEYHKKYLHHREKLLGIQKATEIVGLEFQSQMHLQEVENKDLKQRNELQQEKLYRQNLMLYATLGGILLLLVIAYFLWYNNRMKKQANRQLAEKNEEIHLQNEEIIAQRDHLDQALTELKTTQTQLIQSEKMASLGQLTAGVAHEINNPFNFITANIDTLQENLEEILRVLPEYQKINKDNYQAQLTKLERLKKEYWFDANIEDIPIIIKGIKDGSQRVAKIINGLKVYTHQDGKDMRKLDIHQLLDAALIVLRSRYKDRITIHKDYGDIPEITGYPGELEQVITNILANGIEAIADKGDITLKTSLNTKGKKLVLQIADTGQGMDATTKSRIFEPFFTTKEVGKGVGLGLAIVHKIIEKHQGSISVESEEGVGTKFIITLAVNRS